MRVHAARMRAWPALLAVFAFAAACVLIAAGSALAAPVGSSLYASGLHVATGAIVDPAGRLWVADHNAGFCRLTQPTDTTPAQIEHPQVAGDTTTKRTCLGVLLPDAAPGPDAAGAPTFEDPTPEFPNSGDELVYLPDG